MFNLSISLFQMFVSVANICYSRHCSQTKLLFSRMLATVLASAKGLATVFHLLLQAFATLVSNKPEKLKGSQGPHLKKKLSICCIKVNQGSATTLHLVNKTLQWK